MKLNFCFTYSVFKECNNEHHQEDMNYKNYHSVENKCQLSLDLDLDLETIQWFISP